MFSGYPLQMFLKQLEQLDPNTLAAMYLRGFIIPNYPFIGWFITLGEIAVAIGLLFGRCTRWADLLALWITDRYRPRRLLRRVADSTWPDRAAVCRTTDGPLAGARSPPASAVTRSRSGSNRSSIVRSRSWTDPEGGR